MRQMLVLGCGDFWSVVMCWVLWQGGFCEVALVAVVVGG